MPGQDWNAAPPGAAGSALPWPAPPCRLHLLAPGPRAPSSPETRRAGGWSEGVAASGNGSRGA
eukprot:11165397-Lingulodinium_polyedra.AAC.1